MKELLKEIAQDTLNHSGTISKPKSIYIPSSENIKYAIANSIKKTKITTTKNDVVDVIAKLEKKALVLNFASARNPGGGFLNGARAQEEALCRASNLYLSLKDVNQFYKNPLHFKSGLYDSDIIYSKNVEFFKNGKGEYLTNSVFVDVVTSCAVNVRDLMAKSSGKLNSTTHKQIEAEMRKRITRTFELAMKNKVDVLVLGAFGCGVFKNNPRLIKRIFEETMNSEDFRGQFEEIIFAIYDKELCDIFQFEKR